MSNIPSFGELVGHPEWGNVLPEEVSPEIERLYGIYQTVSADSVLSAQDLQALQTAALLMSSPQLLAPDPTVLAAFRHNISALQASFPPPPGGPHVRILNKWLKVNLTMKMFEAAVLIINLLSQMKLQEAELQIKISHVKVALAKEIAELTVTLGEVAARQCLLEATKAWAQMGAAIAQAICTAGITFAREMALSQPGLTPEQQYDITQRFRSPQDMASSLITAIEQGLIGTVEVGKADLKRLEAEFEADRGQLQTFIEMMTKEIDALRESRSEVAKQIKDFLETLLNLIRTVGEQFRA